MERGYLSPQWLEAERKKLDDDEWTEWERYPAEDDDVPLTVREVKHVKHICIVIFGVVVGYAMAMALLLWTALR
jgi:hypothetical protein